MEHIIVYLNVLLHLTHFHDKFNTLFNTKITNFKLTEHQVFHYAYLL